MTRQQAYADAVHKAIRRRIYIYVVVEGGEWDTATDEDLEMFYLGTEPELCIGPDGYPC